MRPPKGHGTQFEHKSEAAIAALLEHGSVRSAAAAVGVAESTLTRWLEQKSFSDRYRRARHEAVKAGTAKLRSQAAGAVDVLATLMRSSATPPQARIVAARAVLEMTVKITESEDIADRPAFLEAAMKECAL